MPRELLRLLLLSFLIYFLISDILELLSYLPSTSVAFAPLLQRMLSAKLGQNTKLKTSNGHSEETNKGNADATILVNKLHLAHGTVKLASPVHKRSDVSGKTLGKELTGEAFGI